MRTALSRILTAAVIGATAAGVGTLYTAVEPVQGTAHPAPTQVRVWPRGGVEVGDASYTCWVEPKGSPTDAEPICGASSLRPAGSLSIGEETTINGHVWVATVTGLEPVEEV